MKKLALFTVLLIMSTAALYAQETEKNDKIMDNVVLKALKTRRSVRSYKKEQIKDEELKAVLEAGTFAPNGMGKQDSWIVAVQNPQILDQLRRMNAEILGSTSDPYYGAPTIVLVFGSDPKKWGNSIQDGSLVLGNMMNAAYAIGLGSCWINREMQMFSTEPYRHRSTVSRISGRTAASCKAAQGKLLQNHQIVTEYEDTTSK